MRRFFRVVFGPLRSLGVSFLQDFKFYRRRKGGKWFCLTQRPVVMGAISQRWLPGEPSDWVLGPYDSVEGIESY